MKDGEEYNPDVSNSFLIVARAIEVMSANPTEEEKKLLNRIAEIIAIEQTKDLKQSKYSGVWFIQERNIYQGTFQHKKKVYRAYAKTDRECFNKLKIKKQNLLKNGK